MESIYLVISWLCHRRCRHCYDDRFRPYVRDQLAAVVRESHENVPRIIDHLPRHMTYRNADGSTSVGRIILSGGEVLLDPIRAPVLYPALERINERYADNGGIKLIVQTTGDRVTGKIVDELLSRRVAQISISGFDQYHVGINRKNRAAVLHDRLVRMFDAAGMRPVESVLENGNAISPDCPTYNFFGAVDDDWIGKLWPRGRACKNDLSRATIADNFCNRWSGALNFLERGKAGSEVSIEPNGNVYPCCAKTRLPVGNLLEDRLEDIIDSLRENPVYEALNRGDPMSMGLAHGWSRERFIEESTTEMSNGKIYQNLCIGCDRFHEKVLRLTTRSDQTVAASN